MTSVHVASGGRHRRPRHRGPSCPRSPCSRGCGPAQRIPGEPARDPAGAGRSRRELEPAPPLPPPPPRSSSALVLRRAWSATLTAAPPSRRSRCSGADRGDGSPRRHGGAVPEDRRRAHRDRSRRVTSSRTPRVADRRSGLIDPTLDDRGWTYSVPRDDPPSWRVVDARGHVVSIPVRLCRASPRSGPSRRRAMAPGCSCSPRGSAARSRSWPGSCVTPPASRSR